MSLDPCYANLLFWPLAPWLSGLPERPDGQALAQLTSRHHLPWINGRPLRFTPPRSDGLAYETRIWQRGEVETRPDNWHDFFNALVWCAFPNSKQAITAAHVAAMRQPGELSSGLSSKSSGGLLGKGPESGRGTARDALTHFDECGIVVLAADPSLLELLRGFRWRELFVERRAEVNAAMRFIVFGHATYEALLAPFRGLTAKAVLYRVEATELALPPTALVAAVDARLAADIAAGHAAAYAAAYATAQAAAPAAGGANGASAALRWPYRRPRDFQPLPLLGIPGVSPDNDDPTYYDDSWQFRPGRRAADSRAALAPD